MTQTPCHSNRHCLNWGFCNRCNPALADAAQLVVQAIDKAGIPVRDSSAPYGQIMTVLLRASANPDSSERRCVCSHEPDEHSVYGCNEECPCEWTPPSIVHACPPDGSGLTGCCGRAPFEIGRSAALTQDPALVTCIKILQPLNGDLPDRDAQPPLERRTHLAKGTNAEYCPACTGTNPDYPFFCPGPGR